MSAQRYSDARPRQPDVTPASLEGALGHVFREPALLERALTHPSYAHEHPPEPNQEPLAFLGDAVLGLVVAELMMRRAPAEGVGPLTQRRAQLVSGRNLARWARALGLGASLRLGRGEGQGGGREKDSILAATLEAVVGALYLDGGLAVASALVHRLVDAGGLSPSDPA